VREIGVEELFATTTHPLVRHHLDPALTRRAWVSDGATVVDGSRSRSERSDPGPSFICLGPPASLDPLMTSVAATVPPPWRLNVELTSYDAVPGAWRQREHHEWHWMLTRTPPPAPEGAVEEVTSAVEIDAVLDAANPDSYARPGTPGVECWLGVREAGGLVAVGALIRQPDGTGHLRGVSVLPTAAGRGLGRAVSAALTRRALGTGSGVASLGVYTDNAPAIAIYRRLGYTVGHTLASGLSGC
jgi:ribosomal protein S18 acetylase RimI-like enzyme